MVPVRPENAYQARLVKLLRDGGPRSRVSRVDLLRRPVTVAVAFAEVGGELVEGTPKNHQRRSVPIPRFLVD
ncbi:hypothetical protein NCC78_11055, partial [Micromonospora phytophila]|uniref:hypothetical protein n=1 Tax=Micromonospora phytophila TaxID=709888 RepID=UPI00202DC4DD